MSKRSTLNLMEIATCNLGLKEAGYHLILIAADWIDEGDLDRARNALSMITDFYYEHYLVQQTQETELIREAVARLVEAFNVTDFRLLRTRGFQA